MERQPWSEMSPARVNQAAESNQAKGHRYKEGGNKEGVEGDGDVEDHCLPIHVGTLHSANRTPHS